MSVESRIGLALGGGGARGMVHILVCEVFDELGVKPALIAGTSIGAIIGAGYAAGFSGREMRERDLRVLWQAARSAGAAVEGAAARLHRSPARPLDDTRNSTRRSSWILRPRLRAPARDLRGVADPAEDRRLRLLRLDRGNPLERPASPGNRRARSRFRRSSVPSISTGVS